MKKLQWFLALTIAGLAASTSAQARDSFSLGISIGNPYYYAPPPVYYSAPPVVYYNAPQVVYGYSNIGHGHYRNYYRGNGHRWNGYRGHGHGHGHRGRHD